MRHLFFLLSEKSSCPVSLKTKKLYFSSGHLASRLNYKDGLRHGEVISYSEEGELVYKAYYENGVRLRVEVEVPEEEIIYNDSLAWYR